MKLSEAAAAVLCYETDKGQSTCANPAAECYLLNGSLCLDTALKQLLLKLN